MTNVNLQFNPQTLASSLAILTLFSAMYGITYVFADDENDFISITPDSIGDNPAFAKILENIEKSRQNFSDIQQKTDQEKFVSEQRTIAMSILDRELEQMFEDNKDFTSVAAFNNFLKKVSDDNTKHIFQGLFDYKQEKISSAKIVMSDVLRNGGSLQDARDAYHDALQIPRSDMIDLVTNLNIQSGFSDPEIQRHFDKNGKLPRYVDEQESSASFIDLTTSAKNVNTSAKSDVESSELADTVVSENIESSLIQKLLDEIQSLKNQIKLLEERKNSTIQHAVFETKSFDSKYFANWVSDYSQGLGHRNDDVKDVKAIPVNALNAPNSYKDHNNSLALGRQGQVILGFSDSVTGALTVYEASNEKGIRELATVEVSNDGENWTLLTQTQFQQNSSRVHEYGYDLSGIDCISYVRITDNSPSTWGDGFDVDAVGASHQCTDTK